MANRLNVELLGKDVIVSEESFSGTILERTVRCVGGFGCQPNASGQKILAFFLFDGEQCFVGGYQVERLATAEETSLAIERRSDSAEIVNPTQNIN